MAQSTEHGYGWLHDNPDQRDYLFSAPPKVLQTLPPSVNLRPHDCPIYDQGQLGSCTANAIAGAIQFEQIKQGLASATPSRLFIYYGERVIEGTVGSDSGAMIRDGMKVVNQVGAPPETDWPYDIAKFAKKPPAKAFKDALSQKAVQYSRVPRTLAQMKGCLAAGYPFVFGFTVYESFESDAVAKSGIVPMPAHGEAVLGGHAVRTVGYDDAHNWFICANSWSGTWGDKGYFYMPYAYLLSASLSSDYWTIRLIS